MLVERLAQASLGGKPRSSYRFFPGAGRGHGDFGNCRRLGHSLEVAGEFSFFGHGLGALMIFFDRFLLYLMQATSRRGDFHRRGFAPSTRVSPGAVFDVFLVLLRGGKLPSVRSL